MIGVSQAETILVAARDAAGGRVAGGTGRWRTVGRGPPPAPAPWGVYPCAGDDEWCVVTVRDDDDWRRLRGALGDPAWAADDDARDRERAPVHTARDRRSPVRLDARAVAPREVAAVLQSAGVPAGFMQRPEEYENDPQFQARDFLRTFEQPGLAPRRIEHAPFRSERIPAPANRPAPEPGEHTREICTGLLGIDGDTVDRLLAAGALEEPRPAVASVSS